MGFAVAEAARDRGYEVTLIAGPTSAPPPLGMTVVRVRSAAEMAREVRRLEGAHEILVMAAAVADYRPRRAAAQKIHRGEGSLELEMVPTEDILASLRGRREGKATIGFALETDREIEGAERKLAAKGVDLIVLNNPTKAGSEFGGDSNQVVFLHRDGFREDLPLLRKYEVGGEILHRAEDILDRLDEERTEAARSPQRAATKPRKSKRAAAPPRHRRGSR
jgi:phosphopantothenoylcysteine decarboxylase/phosphopantothenate--cysteine ligase